MHPTPFDFTTNRVVWPIPVSEPLVSVVIPTRDRADLLAQCVNGVLNQTKYQNIELVIVDNESVELATLELFAQLRKEDARVRVLSYSGAFNFPALNNAAAREANGEVLLLLNNDISVLEPNWLRELVSHALRPDVGAVGAKLVYPDGRVQHAGIVLGPDGEARHVQRLSPRNDPGYFRQLALARTLTAVTGACLCLRKSVFFEAGGLDEVNLPISYNDVDLCLRIGDLGYRVVWTPFAELFHLESASRGFDDADPIKRERCSREWSYVRKRWASFLGNGDPFYNPNVLQTWERFSVPVPPRAARTWHPGLAQAFDLDGVSYQGAAPKCARQLTTQNHRNQGLKLAACSHSRPL